MKIHEFQGVDDKVEYEVEFIEHQLEEVAARLNRFARADEKPFESARAISDLNQQAYELFARPLVQAFATDEAARLARDFHPLRWQRWFLSDENPWMKWLAPAAQTVKSLRQPVEPEQPFRQVERMLSEMISGTLDLYRDMRDALSESLFFVTYGNLLPTRDGADEQRPERDLAAVEDPRNLSFVREALASIDKGGYPEALARVAALLARRGLPIPLARLELKEELLADYEDLLPDLTRDQMRRLRGRQEIVVRYEHERALETLPQLVPTPIDRTRLLTLLERVLADPRLTRQQATPMQLATLERIRELLGSRQSVPLLTCKELSS